MQQNPLREYFLAKNVESSLKSTTKKIQLRLRTSRTQVRIFLQQLSYGDFLALFTNKPFAGTTFGNQMKANLIPKPPRMRSRTSRRLLLLVILNIVGNFDDLTFRMGLTG